MNADRNLADYLAQMSFSPTALRAIRRVLEQASAGTRPAREGEPMSDLNNDQTVKHIDAALAAGEPMGLNVDRLVDDVSTVLMATGNLVHLKSHDFVEAEEVQPHVEMLLSSIGGILFQLAIES
jgi:hypothetical protein